MNLLKRAWKAAPAAVVILGIAGVVAIFFTVRTTLAWIYWADPAHRDQEIAGWMTPRYVAMSWDIPRPVMIELVGLPFADGGPRNIDRIAETLGLTTEQYVAELETKIRAWRAEQDAAGARK